MLVRLLMLIAIVQATGCANMMGNPNPVLAAVLKENPEKLRAATRARRLYDDGTPEIDGTNICGERALHLATKANNVAIALILLEEGADPNLPSETPREPALCKSLDIVHPPPGLSPLHYAIIAARPRIVATLLFAGADPMLTTPANETALELAESMVGLETIVPYMRSAMHLAARTGDMDRLARALESDADVNDVLNVIGTTPIEEALLHGHWQVVEFLLNKGAGYQPTLSSTQVREALARYLEQNIGSNHSGRLRSLAALPTR